MLRSLVGSEMCIRDRYMGTGIIQGFNGNNAVYKFIDQLEDKELTWFRLRYCLQMVANNEQYLESTMCLHLFFSDFKKTYEKDINKDKELCNAVDSLIKATSDVKQFRKYLIDSQKKNDYLTVAKLYSEKNGRSAGKAFGQIVKQFA
eukprot:TRINITY_DN1943_c0_g1_i10.p2 TRINITY_DN1943_c0_g1~~TRINITY_DN1943_c0_g1_i10.p2  ORF type:complete len:147 (-),score=40.63 TRINITY_DN1943_c0_g1_i10:116-556(-)